MSFELKMIIKLLPWVFVLFLANSFAAPTAVQTTTEDNIIVNVSVSYPVERGQCGLSEEEQERREEQLYQKIQGEFSKEINKTKEELYEHLEDLEEELVHKICNKVMEKIQLGNAAQPATSCKQLAELRPQSPSGYYWVRSSNGTAVLVYCDMSRRCCNTTGGWTRIAYLNMTDPSHHCPPAWREINGICGKSIPYTECKPAYFSSQGLPYTHACGRILAYQFGYTYAFHHHNAFPGRGSIDWFRFSGVSVTRGNPRQHVWTFVTARAESATGITVCPCTNATNTATINIPPFVGQDYFCETGTANSARPVLYDSDPLWDGQGCGPTSTCCEFNNPPWFCKELPETTTDDIEVRICEGHTPAQADTRIELIEIYVQ